MLIHYRANTIPADTNVDMNQTKTHLLLEEISRNTHNDDVVQRMMTELHAILTAPIEPHPSTQPGQQTPKSNHALAESITETNYTCSPDMPFSLPYHTRPKHLSPTTIELNSERLAFGLKEYEAFKTPACQSREQYQPSISTHINTNVNATSTMYPVAPPVSAQRQPSHPTSKRRHRAMDEKVRYRRDGTTGY